MQLNVFKFQNHVYDVRGTKFRKENKITKFVRKINFETRKYTS